MIEPKLNDINWENVRAYERNHPEKIPKGIRTLLGESSLYNVFVPLFLVISGVTLITFVHFTHFKDVSIIPLGIATVGASIMLVYSAYRFHYARFLIEEDKKRGSLGLKTILRASLT